MKYQKILTMLFVFLSLAVPSFAGNLLVNSTNQGAYTDVNVVRACGSTARTGMKAIIDTGCAKQTDTAGTSAAQTIIQSSTVSGTTNGTVVPVVAVECTAGGLKSCPCYTTTASTKSGSIAITVNGVVKYIDFKDGPN